MLLRLRQMQTAVLSTLGDEMTKHFEITAVASASSQTSSRGSHRTSIILLTDSGEKLVLGLSGHAVARLKKHLANALLPRSVTENAA